MMSKKIYGIFVFVIIVILLTSCATEKKRTAVGAGVGAVAGAGIGAIIGHQTGHTGAGAAIGAATGALIGGGIGYYLDKQAADLRKIQEIQNVKQERDRLIATMSNSLLFDVNSAIIKPGAVDGLTQVADVLNRYPETTIIVKGYTDSTGTEAYNQELSERRAKSVANFMIGKGVDPGRVSAIGFGEQFPIAGNDTEAGRQQNRRVELEIIPRDSAGPQG
ncbi:MAG: OmpA family protein [Thermodesulfobacteriota bacterium]|nr:MAG: OmpA family protein [Thermodesulfobacteriota bacterium]